MDSDSARGRLLTSPRIASDGQPGSIERCSVYALLLGRLLSLRGTADRRGYIWRCKDYSNAIRALANKRVRHRRNRFCVCSDRKRRGFPPPGRRPLTLQLRRRIGRLPHFSPRTTHGGVMPTPAYFRRCFRIQLPARSLEPRKVVAKNQV